MTHHGMSHLRGMHEACTAHLEGGRFRRLFSSLPPLLIDDDALAELGGSQGPMFECGSNSGADSPTIPAAFTFFGQFIDHDITLDVTSSLERQADPAATRNFRSPVLELDSVYGEGPEATPFLYTEDERLLTRNDGTDLPRNEEGTALIGDPRNDENLLISQMQLAFLKFHNKVLELLENDEIACTRMCDSTFEEAQRIVRWHYQWIVVNEYLPLIVGEELVCEILDEGPRFYPWGIKPFVPIEFAVAAYRFGHSQVRKRYKINHNVDMKLFELPAFSEVSPEQQVDWTLMFEQDSRQIDTKIASELFNLPFAKPSSLPVRNLLRGKTFNLPSGQTLAERMGETPLTMAEMELDDDSLSEAPAWYYILKEAELQDGDHLGPVGGRLVAETLLGLLKNDQDSYLAKQPDWKPCVLRWYTDDSALLELLKFGDAVMPGRSDKWEFYKDDEDGWRWRRIAPNGEIVGSAHEGYVSRADCVANAERHGYVVRNADEAYA